VPALSEFFGDGAGLSGPVVARLTRTWQDEQAAFASRSLAEVDYVYIWVDGITSTCAWRGPLCCLVVVGVRADGRKELVASPAVTRVDRVLGEPFERLQAPGMRAPVLAVATAPSGSGAVRDVFLRRPSSAAVPRLGQRAECPPEVSPAGRPRALAEIRDAEDKATPRLPSRPLPTSSSQVAEGRRQDHDKPDALLAFYDMPAEHWST